MHRSKIFLWFLGLVLTAFFLVPLQEALSQESADELYEAAVFKKEAEGDLQGAIQIFLKAIAKFPENRKVAAKAQLQIGICYEKLGTKEAEKAFQKVIDNYPEQSEPVREAKEKLSLLLRSRAFIETGDTEFKIRQVWTGPGADVEGAVSPDGRFLSFVDWETGDLAIRELASGTNRRLTNKGSWMQSPEMALFSKWSPDSRQVAYCWINKDKGVELHCVDVDGSNHRVLYQKKMGYVQPFDWSPDGKHILAIFNAERGKRPGIGDEKNERLQLGLISAEDGSLRIIKNFIFGINMVPWSFVFSPDGHYIAYDSPRQDAPSSRDIFLLSADGSLEVPLVDHPALDYVLGWTPDGKGLLFASERTGSRSAWLIQVAEGKPQGLPKLIKQDIGPISAMGFTRQGAFFYGISSDISDVYVTRLDPAAGKILDPAKKAVLHYEGHNYFPAYSADGEFLAYMSLRNTLTNLGRGNPNVLCIQSLKTGQIRELSLDLASYGYPRWSPKGRYISVEGQDREGRTGIYLVEIQTGDVVPLIQCDSGMVIYSHRWSKDGVSIFYASGDDDLRERKQGIEGSSYVFVLDIETGQEKKLLGSPSDAKFIDISPDGQWLVILNRDKKRTIKIMPVSGGDPREIYSFEQEGNHIISPAWSADGSYILFSKVRPYPEEMWDLYGVSVEGGDAKKLGLSMNQFRHFSLHPDGQQFAFSSKGSATRFAEVWVMENFLPVEKVKK